MTHTPIKEHRYTYGDLIRVTQRHFVWLDHDDDAFERVTEGELKYVENGEILIFIQAYGYRYLGTNWKRPQWNLLVISGHHGKIWVSDEYTELAD